MGQREHGLSRVELYVGTAGVPIHCPFCGQPALLDTADPCDHVLYIIVEGAFYEASERFLEAAGLNKSYTDEPDAIPWPEIHDRGGAHEIASRIEIRNHVQFALQTANDVIKVGFWDGFED